MSAIYHDIFDISTHLYSKHWWCLNSCNWYEVASIHSTNIETCLKDTQQERCTTKAAEAAAVATSCVCLNIHSRILTAMEIKVLDQSTARNINFFNPTMCSPKATTAVIHLVTTRLRVQCATWEVVQQSSWFQQEHSVQTAGLRSMEDIWFPAILASSAAATFAGTRHRKLQLVQQMKTKLSCTLLKSTVEHCHVQCTSLEESWPAWFALNDEPHDAEEIKHWYCYYVSYMQ